MESNKECPICRKRLVGNQKTYCSRECRYIALKEKAQVGFLAEGRRKPRKRADSKLAQLRTDRGLTQAQLIEMTGLSHATISAIESGRAKSANISTYQRIAAALGVDWKELAE